MVQWLRLHAFTAGDTSSIPGQTTKILHVWWFSQKKKNKKKLKALPKTIKSSVKPRQETC